MGLSVAIVGAGPAAFYTVEALLGVADVEIDIIERLPTPYGLIRAGVAPDHQSTKKVARKFERTVLDHAVRFFGNVEVGGDVALDELRAIYDAVVLAVGSPNDRPLGIPGENRRGVYGSSLFVGWYNGHPDFRDLEPIVRGPTAVVVGNGNVALDVARVLVMSDAELAASDIPDYGIDILRRSGIREVVVAGRRGPLDARFANAELRELLDLDEAVALVEPEDLPESVVAGNDDRERRRKDRNLAVFREFARARGGEKRRRIRFRFFAAPVAIEGDDVATGVRFQSTAADGAFLDIACHTVVTAIGYRREALCGAPFDAARGVIASADGRIEPGFYVVGWAKRGPSGVISSNRPDGETCARQIAADFAPGLRSLRGSGRRQLEELLARRGVRAISFADWLAIDRAEMTAARAPAPRTKLTTLGEVLAVLDRHTRADAGPRLAEERTHMTDRKQEAIE